MLLLSGFFAPTGGGKSLPFLSASTVCSAGRELVGHNPFHEPRLLRGEMVRFQFKTTQD